MASPKAKDYATLTYRGQVGRMRALARRALPRFGLPADAPLVLCGHGENTVFRTADRRGRSYALRIHRTDYQSPASIRSEMAWLRALTAETDITVPRPRAGRDGADVQIVDAPGVPNARCCVLLHWTAGRRVGLQRSRPYWLRLGELTGQLHAHAAAWRRPRDFARLSWDERALLIAPVFGDPFSAPGLRRRDRDLFAAARDRALEELRAFGKGRRRWGLIHADLHSGNVVTDAGVIHPIDFDDCGFGWYLYDIVVAAITPVWRTPAYEPTVATFLEGYRRVRAFDEGDLATVDAFVVARKLDIVGWLAKRRDNPALVKYIPRVVQGARTGCRAYLRV